MKIGITGHQQRDGIDWRWVRLSIDEYLTGKAKVMGYSSLAIGTDQVFAEAVLAKGGTLVAVIPLDDYKSHFEAEDISHFEKLKSSAQLVELKSKRTDNQAFLDAGKWISREADRMIAVWDGEPAEQAGGTGDIVAYTLSLGKSVYHIDPIKRRARDL